MTDDKNRRQSDRHDLADDIEIFHKGYAIEFPTKDISLTGMGVELGARERGALDDPGDLPLASGRDRHRAARRAQLPTAADRDDLELRGVAPVARGVARHHAGIQLVGAEITPGPLIDLGRGGR